MEQTRIAPQAYEYHPSGKQNIGRSKVEGDVTTLEAGTGDFPYQ
jgi:hypothetical protein